MIPSRYWWNDSHQWISTVVAKPEERSELQTKTGIRTQCSSYFRVWLMHRLYGLLLIICWLYMHTEQNDVAGSWGGCTWEALVNKGLGHPSIKVPCACFTFACYNWPLHCPTLVYISAGQKSTGVHCELAGSCMTDTCAGRVEREELVVLAQFVYLSFLPLLHH